VHVAPKARKATAGISSATVQGIKNDVKVLKSVADLRSVNSG